MTRPRKRAGHRSAPHTVNGAGESATTPLAPSAPKHRISSRIEVKGLDLELVATLAAASSDALDEAILDTASDTGADSRAAVLCSAMLNTVNETEANAEAIARFESQVLRSELTQIGVVLDLPVKRVNRPTVESHAAAHAARLGAVRFPQWIAGIIVFIGAGIGAAALRTPPAPVLPTALLGEWATSNPEYQGRQLAFVEAQIVLRVAADAPLTRHPIVAMTSRTVADTTLLGLIYSTEGGEVELHARLVGRERPTLVFDRPIGLVWERRVE